MLTIILKSQVRRIGKAHVCFICPNLRLHSQVVKLVQEIGAITVRGNHDEAALERYHSWKSTGTLDVSSRTA